MSRLTASRVALAAHCLHWTTVDAPPVESAAATEGTRVHGLIQEWLDGGGVGEIDAPWFRGLRSWIDAHAPFTVPHTEITFALDVMVPAARVLGQSLDRDYSRLDPGEFAGTADCAWIDGDTATIVDWKYHSDDHAPDISGPPSAFGQLMFLGAAAALAWSVKRVKLAYVHIYGSGEVRGEPEDVTSYSLAEFVDLLRGMLLNGDRAPQPGPHCTALYCPALARCPAVHEEASQLVPVSQLTAGIQTTADVMRWLDVKPRIEELIERLNKEARAQLAAAGGRLELPDGSVYRETVCHRTGFSASKARELLGSRAAECEQVTEYTRATRTKAKERKTA